MNQNVNWEKVHKRHRLELWWKYNWSGIVVIVLGSIFAFVVTWKAHTMFCPKHGKTKNIRAVTVEAFTPSMEYRIICTHSNELVIGMNHISAYAVTDSLDCECGWKVYTMMGTNEVLAIGAE